MNVENEQVHAEVRGPERQAAGRGRGRGNRRGPPNRNRPEAPRDADPAGARREEPPDRSQSHYPSIPAPCVSKEREVRLPYFAQEYIDLAVEVYNSLVPRLRHHNLMSFTLNRFCAYCLMLLAKRVQGILQNRRKFAWDQQRAVNMPQAAIPAPIYAYLASLGDHVDQATGVTYMFDFDQDLTDEIVRNAENILLVGPLNYVWQVIGVGNAVLTRSYHVIFTMLLDADVTIDACSNAQLRLQLLQEYPIQMALNQAAAQAVQVWLDGAIALQQPIAAQQPVGNQDVDDTIARLVVLINNNFRHVIYAAGAALNSRVYAPPADFLVVLNSIRTFYQCNEALPNTFTGSVAQFAYPTEVGDRIHLDSPFHLSPTYIAMACACKFRVFDAQLPAHDNFDTDVPRETPAAIRTRWLLSCFK